MSAAFNMRANWRQMEPRRMLEMAKRHNARVTPYTRGIGQRSYIVSWTTECSPDCEGNLFVLRVRTKRVNS